MAAPVVHFEIHAADPDRCRAFYEAVFGWVTNDVPGMEQQYWLMFPTGKIQVGPDGGGGPGIAGGMLNRIGQPPSDDSPVNGYVCILEVDDVEKSFHAVQAHGGTIALPIQEISGVGRVFYGKDTEGNLFGAMQPAPTQDAVMEMV